MSKCTLWFDGWFNISWACACQLHDDRYMPVAEGLEGSVVTPTSPVRMFAGRDDTICLKFANRDEWLGLGYEHTDID